MEQGLLDINQFHNEDGGRIIDLVAGRLHGARFRMILTRALGIQSNQLGYVPLRDVYGTPATDFRDSESAPVAIAKEVAAIAITRQVVRLVRPGDIDSLKDAEGEFKRIALRLNRAA